MKNCVVHSLLFGLLIFNACFADGQPLVHPGLLHSREDLQRMKKAVAARVEPVYAGYQVFIQNPASRYDYKRQGPLDTVGRNPTVGAATYDSDANAAHQNAVQWAITGDRRYAEKAIEIVNAWSGRLKAITGRDAVLMAGLGPFKMINAAEILRYTDAGWQDAAIRQAEQHFKGVIYPVLKSYAPFANGNWEAAAMKTVMAIGVFCNDRLIFEDALRYYTNGGGNGRLTNYIINEAGQIQESGRDQPHSQLGIGMLAECCAIAWNQGLDLYRFADNRLLKGFEYTAKYNLGQEDLPFQEWLDRTGKYHHFKISDKGRGELRAVYEQVYNHYVKQKGLMAPFTRQAAEKLRPEGPGKPGADHPGYGTLYFTVPASAGNTITGKPAVPAALVATGSSAGNQLGWVASVGAATYSVKRAIRKAGPFTTIAGKLSGTSYTDREVKAGLVYYYTVAATNAKGESGHACPVAIAAGLPAPWQQQNIGRAEGRTVFNGTRYTTESTGAGMDSVTDEAHFTYQRLAGDGTITLCYVPQFSSQFSRIGLCIREKAAAAANQVSLVLYPGKTDQVEAPDWQVGLLVKGYAGQQTGSPHPAKALTQPAVSFGRMTGHCWLRLQRQGNRISGYISYDGKDWQPVGTVAASLAKEVLIGFFAASGMANSTVVSFEQVAVKVR